MKSFLAYHDSTSLQQLESDIFAKKAIQLWVKRDDLLHEAVSGNKWRKLKYNIEQALAENHKQLLTFGGAYSNHIYATAAAGKLTQLKTIGIIRGEEHQPLNPTLTFATSQGMKLHYMTRNKYRLKNTDEVIENLKANFGEFYLIPEGGSNGLAIKGCAEIVEEIEKDFDYICCACGTGGTLAGILSALPKGKKALGFSALKGGYFLHEEVEKLLKAAHRSTKAAWQIQTEYHFGGYAKVKPELLAFIKSFEEQFAIPLEPVYTGKLFYGVFDLISKDYFPRNTKIIVVHTGGLQTNQTGTYTYLTPSC